ncbi:MAG: hypothetical protein RI926_624 [Actinomycetota bacterium]|jgi:hypothetical protein
MATPETRDRVTAIILLVLTFLSSFIFFVFALIVGLTKSACTGGCNEVVYDFGAQLTWIGPGIMTILSLVLTIQKLYKRESATTIALIGLGGAYGASLLGVAISFIDIAVGQG